MTINGHRRIAPPKLLVCPDTGNVIHNDKRGRKMPRAEVLRVIAESKVRRQPVEWDEPAPF